MSRAEAPVTSRLAGQEIEREACRVFPHLADDGAHLVAMAADKSRAVYHVVTRAGGKPSSRTAPVARKLVEAFRRNGWLAGDDDCLRPYGCSLAVRPP